MAIMDKPQHIQPPSGHMAINPMAKREGGTVMRWLAVTEICAYDRVKGWMSWWIWRGCHGFVIGFLWKVDGWLGLSIDG